MPLYNKVVGSGLTHIKVLWLTLTTALLCNQQGQQMELESLAQSSSARAQHEQPQTQLQPQMQMQPHIMQMPVGQMMPMQQRVGASVDELLTTAQLGAFCEPVRSMGVATIADFQDVDDEDLIGCGLNKIQIRRLRRRLLEMTV
eukprot:COSAG01_NODE_3199_length_6426_cov_6.255726_2_plen_144_part_00